MTYRIIRLNPRKRYYVYRKKTRAKQAEYYTYGQIADTAELKIEEII